MEKYHIFPALFWIGLSLFVMVFSYRLGLEGFHHPGPGLMPFLLGLLLLPLSLYLLMGSLLKKREGDETGKGGEGQTDYGKIGLVLLALFVYALLLERLGFLITTSVFLLILFRSMGNRWITVLVASVLTVLTTYFVFTFFGVRFPTGIFGAGG
jgi:putative tricarboxylic transport membrane protein